MTLHSIPSNEVPEGAVSGFVTTADGRQIRFARWRPASGCRGTVALFPGRAEFIEKYFEVVRDLLARGFAVATLDWRGQGGSQRLLRNPRKGHVRRFSDYQLDLEAFGRQVLLADCPAPHFALAHSMGGAILLEAIIDGRRWFDRVVLSGPLLDIALVPYPALARTLAATLSAIGFARAFVPGGGGTLVNTLPFATNLVTSDPERYARSAAVVEAHPELGLGAPTIGWVHQTYLAMAALRSPEVMREIRQPLLMIAAGDERVVSNAAIQHMASRLIAGAYVTVPAARHEILMERDIFRAQFWAAFDAFIPGSSPF
ncbi:lysophospholipase [Azorhizobium oxalatiphilum]|uniref:Lysophospholipase n=1 Tax=Azorhizobium oxalatiphilum TaxID=980631 RepID=A0A917BJC6_9HYPH|nr:alpha/beta hydrolase [Azorhizobium oxalatiphilum]GGF45324.1 lysophospholipase [Azorhizobium oxalatiphilum]